LNLQIAVTGHWRDLRQLQYKCSKGETQDSWVSLKTLAWKMCIRVWVAWGISYFSTYKDRWVWQRVVFATGNGSRGKSGAFPRSPLCSHKASLVVTLQQMENYAVYGERQGDSLMSNSDGVSYPLGFPAFTFTCTNSPCPLFYLLKRIHPQHCIPFPVHFV